MLSPQSTLRWVTDYHIYSAVLLLKWVGRSSVYLSLQEGAVPCCSVTQLKSNLGNSAPFLEGLLGVAPVAAEVTSGQHCWSSPWASRLTSLLPSNLVVGPSRSQLAAPWGPVCICPALKHLRNILVSLPCRPFFCSSIRLAQGNPGVHLRKGCMESQGLSGAGVITVCLNIPTPNIWAQASAEGGVWLGPRFRTSQQYSCLTSLQSPSLLVPPNPTSPPE